MKTIRLIRSVAYLAFILASGYVLSWCIVVIGLNNHPVPTIVLACLLTAYFLIHITQLTLAVKNLDLILGTLNFAITGYFVLAILDDYFDWKAGRDLYSDPTRQLYINGLIIFTMFALSIVMVCVNGRLKKKKLQTH